MVLDLVSLGILALVFFGLVVFSTPPGLTGDEIATYTISLDGNYLRQEEYRFNPPLVFVLSWIVRVLGGSTVYAFRIPHLFFVFGAILVTYFTGKLIGSRWAGLFSSLVLATTYMVARYALINRQYSLLLFFSCLSIFFWYRLSASIGRSRVNEVGLFVSMLLAFLSHYFAVSVFFGLFAGSFFIRDANRRLVLKNLVLSFIVVLPLLIVVATSGVPYKIEEGIQYKSMSASPGFLSVLLDPFLLVGFIIKTLEFFNYEGWPLIVMFLVTGILGLIYDNRPHVSVALFVMFLSSTLIGFLARFTILWGWRYLLLVVPPIALLSGYGFSWILEIVTSRIRGDWARLGVTLALLFIVVALFWARTLDAFSALNKPYGVYPEGLYAWLVKSEGTVFIDDYDTIEAIWFLELLKGSVYNGSVYSFRETTSPGEKYPPFWVLEYSRGLRLVYFNPDKYNVSRLDIPGEYSFVSTRMKYDSHSPRIDSPCFTGNKTECNCNIIVGDRLFDIWKCTLGR